MSVTVRRPEGAEPASQELGGGRAVVQGGQRRPEPRVGRRPPVLARDPGSARAAAHDRARRSPAGTARGWRRRPARPTSCPRRTRVSSPSCGHRPGELGAVASPRSRSAAIVLRSTRRSQRAPSRVTPWLLEHPDQPPPLAGRERLRAGLVHDRGELDRHDEHRAAHPEHPHERAALVQGVLEIGVHEVAHARAGSEIHRGRVAGVQSDHRSAAVVHRVERPCQPVADRETGAPLLDIDRLHGAHASARLADARRLPGHGRAVAAIGGRARGGACAPGRCLPARSSAPTSRASRRPIRRSTRS